MSFPCVTHLDLKGAPPNVDYLTKLFIPFIKKHGSWGVLLEWEDTFPFTSDLIGIGSLGGCSRDGMYNVDDVKCILNSIKGSGMEPIQLVQTIGHMEFVLKHGQYRRLREVPHSPAVLCPSRPESRTLVENMIAQVLSVQPDANYIHIGADEVWHLNVCDDCQAKSAAQNCDALALYLDHIRAVCTFIKSKYPNIRILMWDDMLRNVPVDVMKAYDLGNLVQPVVWNYNIREHFNFDKQMWERYSFVFLSLWVASAFKGANGSAQISCSVPKYISNQIAWHDELVIYEGEINFSGIVLTGWSRYDHYATLCELLPVALPSLAACLRVWSHPELFDNERMIPDTLASDEWPGHKVAESVIALATLRERILQFVDGDTVTTWLNQWQIDHDYTNPLHVERIAEAGEMLESDLQLVGAPLSAALHAWTGRRSAEEFVQTFVAPLELRVRQLRARAHARKDRPAGLTPNFDHPNVIEGQGSIGIEILEQLPSVDAILVPCGGGSLLCGIAIAAKFIKPEVEVYGIETDKVNSMVESLRKNERTYLPIDTTIADGLAVPMVGVNTFHNIKGLVDKMVVVKEDWVARGIMHIIEEERLVVEGAGAVGVAAIMAGLFPNLKGKKVVAVLSGGNIDTTTLARALERGMAAEGRLVKFKVTVQDRPGGMADLCSLLSSVGVTMRDCVPERAWVKGDVFSVELKVIAETRGWDHAKEMIEAIKKNYKHYLFQEMNERQSPSTKRGPCLAPNPACMQK